MSSPYYVHIPLAALKALKRNADEEATKQTKHRRICSQRLLTAVSQELQKRRAAKRAEENDRQKLVDEEKAAKRRQDGAVALLS